MANDEDFQLKVLQRLVSIETQLKQLNGQVSNHQEKIEVLSEHKTQVNTTLNLIKWLAGVAGGAGIVNLIIEAIRASP